MAAEQEEQEQSAAPDKAAKFTVDDAVVTQRPAADIAQPTVPPAPTQQAQAPTAATAPAPVTTAQGSAPQAAVPLQGVGFEIASKALSGRNQFDIRLDPPDLGHIHVRLNVDRDGNVISHMVADRTDTLDLLRRDTANLERALQDAGLKTSDNSLQFSLRDQTAGQQQNENAGGNTAHIVVNDEKPGAATQRDYTGYGTRAGGLDIRV